MIINLAKNEKVLPAVADQLKYYVYLYSHPVTGEIFYVGKGSGNRVFSHIDDRKESAIVNYIKSLKSEGLQPKIEILIHGLEDEVTALRVEVSIIDLIGIKNLTNKQSGYKSTTHGRMLPEQVNALYNSQPINIEVPSILIRLSQEVYEIYSWHKAGSTESTRNSTDIMGLNTPDSLIGRYEFIGKIASTIIREQFRHNSVQHYFSKGNSNPITYCNIS